MQASPYLVVEGTVVGFRRVEIPAREPEDYTTANGQTKTTKYRAASSYSEVGVNCPAVLDGAVSPDVRSVLTVRWPEDTPFPAKGDAVRWAVEAAKMVGFFGGRWRDWIVFYFHGLAPDVAAPSGLSRSSLAAAS